MFIHSLEDSKLTICSNIVLGCDGLIVQSQGSPVTPVNSSPSPNSATSDPSAPWLLSEETDSGTGSTYRAGEKEHQGDVGGNFSK